MILVAPQFGRYAGAVGAVPGYGVYPGGGGGYGPTQAPVAGCGCGCGKNPGTQYKQLIKILHILAIDPGI